MEDANSAADRQSSAVLGRLTVYPGVQEEGMVAHPGEEDLHDKGAVVKQRDPGHLQVHGQVRHVRLQLGERLLALGPNLQHHQVS